MRGFYGVPMSALIKTFSVPGALQLQPRPEAVPAKVLLVAHPVQLQLCERLAVAGGELMRNFVDALDAAVQALLAESRNAVETRAVLDLGHALSLNRPALLRGFITALQHRFDPLRQPAQGGIFDLERRCLLPSEEMEENIVLAHLSQLAEQKAGEDGRQLCSRLQWAARDLSLPALSGALSAAALPECFAQAFRQAGLSTAERVLAYRLVESHALKAWPELVRTALLVLDQQGLCKARSLADGAGIAAQDAAPMISTATMQTLREARVSLVSGADGALAKALLHDIEPPFRGSAAGLITALAGAWVDGLLAQPELPPALAPELESLRLPVIKAALCDPSFLTHPGHPMRQSVDEIVQQAAFVGLLGYSLAPLRGALKEIVSRVGIHGRFARDALAMMPPLEPDMAQRFQLQMGRDQDAHRENLLQRVRTLVTREIEARTLDVALPSAARAALTRGFLPLLSTLMLRHGAASGPTRQARQLLERFVDSFALCTARTERQAVLRELGDMLVAVGLQDLQVSGVCTALETAYAALEEEAHSDLPGHHSGSSALREIDEILLGMGVSTSSPPQQHPASDGEQYLPVPPAASADLLQVLLRPGQWFRVRDYKRGDDRWLSLAGVHLDQDRLSFSGFDGVTVLAMRASQFVEDLSSGLAEPVNPSVQWQRALQALSALPAAALERLQSFG